MKRIWEGVALGCKYSIEIDAGKLRVFRIDGSRSHETPDYEDLVIREAFIDLAMQLEKHEPLPLVGR